MNESEICVDTLPPDFSKWVDDMDAAANEVDLFREEADWKKPSIYHVTGFAGCHEPINAFTPQVIPFGPFHHGAEHLKENEVHKQRALAHFLHRAEMPSEPFVNKLQRILKRLQDSYGQGLDKKWIENPYEFLKMMLRDGCFMIEVLRMNECSDDYATNDPVFSSQMNHLRKPYIKQDMLLLENQLPLLVLKALLEVENRGPTDDKYINSLVLYYCGETLKENLSRLASHPLELYHISMLHEDTIVQVKSPPINETKAIENAVELRESGVRFRANYNCTSLMNINFDPKTGCLDLPVLTVHDGTEHLLLNMIAYEQIHVGAAMRSRHMSCSWNALINTEDDVKLLQKKNIIINSLRRHKDVTDLFKGLTMGLTHNSKDALNAIRTQLSEYYEKGGNKMAPIL